MVEERICNWALSNNSFMGFADYEYNTDCKVTYDSDIIRPINPIHCPNCGGRVIHSK